MKTDDGQTVDVHTFESGVPHKSIIATIWDFSDGAKPTLETFNCAGQGVTRSLVLEATHEKKWVNIYHSNVLYDTEQEALKHAAPPYHCIATIEIEVERNFDAKQAQDKYRTIT